MVDLRSDVRPDPALVRRLRSEIGAGMGRVRADLEALVRTPSVAFDGFDPAQVLGSAESVAGLLRSGGLDDVRVVRGCHRTGARAGAAGMPAVLGRRPAAPGAPTVLLYAHHDVQPPGPDGDWLSPPFEPTERAGRLYGRGAADDKAGVMVHVAALRAFRAAVADTGGAPAGLGVTVFVEGEEEVGSPTFRDLLDEHHDDLAADVIVVADSTNWAVGTPALTSSLRGLVDCVVEVAVLDHPVHSGLYGGPVLDALTLLCRMLAGLHDEDGTVAVAGLVGLDGSAPAPGSGEDMVEYDEARFRREAGVVDGVRLAGSGSLSARLWHAPAAAVLGIDAPPVALAGNTLVPRARAKVSLRLAPGDDPASAARALREHLLAAAPLGAQVEVHDGERGPPFAADPRAAADVLARWALGEAWGSTPVRIGMGGSIPFVADLQERYPHAAVLITGVEDPDSRAHSPNESLHLGELERACLAESLLLAAVALAAR